MAYLCRVFGIDKASVAVGDSRVLGAGLPTRQYATLATPEPAQKRALESTNPAAIGRLAWMQGTETYFN